MDEPRRLFDCIELQLEKFPKEDMLAAKVNGSWKKYSTSEVRDIVNKLSAGLLQLGLSGNDMSDKATDKIAIISNNRPEWLFTDLAVQQTGAVLVPIYPTTNPNELQFILNNAEVKCIFVSSEELLNKVKSICSNVPSLKNIYVFDKIEGHQHWTELTESATAETLKRVEEIKSSISEDHLATIIYTSGTTGTPKGVMLTHKNIVSDGLYGIESFPFKRKLFFWSVAIAEKYDNNIIGGPLYKMKLSIANKLVFSKWREALGGNIKFVITGGAACPEKLLRIFNGAKIPLYEGYGPTENSPVIAVNRQEPGGTKYGTVGPPIKGIEVKLAEDGEICVRGSTVMKGYYKRPDLTAETIIDGWLHTGDIGVWVDNKFLKITDRKKELFKTSGGKYVAPQPIENKLKESPYIEQVIVVGAEHKFVGALIVPSFSNLKVWMQQQGLTFTSNEEVISNPKVLEMYKQVVEAINQNFNHVEQIKKFELLPREWSIETGEMTPKMSLKRKIIMEKYRDAIERIYA